MNFTVEVEKPSPIVRKLTIRVPAATVTNRFKQGLVTVQKDAKIKGFRPGHVPMNIVQQMYGSDVRHRLMHDLIDEFYDQAIREQKLKAVGQPKIETPDHKTGEGAHDHSLDEGKDLTFIATVEVVPEIEAKGYTGIALTKGKVEATEQDIELVIKNLLDSQAELTPVSGGLLGADGKPTASRAAQMGDHADITFEGGLVNEDDSVTEKQGMKGSRVIEIGSDSLIEGFEQNLIGMNISETRTFRVPFPADFYEKDLAGKMSQFTVTLNDLKEKKLPKFDDELAKTMGYESVADMRDKAKSHLIRERTQEVDRRLRSDLLQNLIEKNEFDVPAGLIQGQTRLLAQDLAGNLKNQGFNDQMIQEALGAEIENLKKRADNQVRASLILESIAKKEGIVATPEHIEAELQKMIASMQIEEAKVREFYDKNAGRREDLEFRVREDQTVQFVLGKSKIKEK